MAEKTKGKSVNLVYVIIAIVVVIAVGFGIYKLASNNSSNITISDKDSNDVKTEKIQKKIEALNKEIEDLNNKINPELEKLNGLYEEYVNIMNEYQTGEPNVTPEEQEAAQTVVNAEDTQANEQNQ